MAMRHLEADLVSDPIAESADAALVTAGAEVPGLAGEGQQLFMAAVGALEPGEPGGKIAASVELVDHGDSILAQWSVSLAVAGFVVGDELVPCVMDNLPEWRGAGTTRTVDG